ncbi:MAG: hypothetical protein LBR81_09820 [Prevotellaceae bacterium]|jgi:hypothetical protein|nr:hypothetical protein [Prevotellaceae bacterium]
MYKVITSVLLIALFASCRTIGVLRQEALQPIDYVRWIENKDNGLKIDMEDSPYLYELQYQPVAYLAIRQTNNPQITPAALKQAIDNRGDYLYFSLKMQKQGERGILSDMDINSVNKNSYLLSGIQNDMFVLSGGDSLQCVMSHFESANSLIPYDRCVLAFEKPKDEKDDLVFLFRTDVYRRAWLRIPIKRENINKIPQLKIK